MLTRRRKTQRKRENWGDKLRAGPQPTGAGHPTATTTITFTRNVNNLYTNEMETRFRLQTPCGGEEEDVGETDDNTKETNKSCAAVFE